ncbi:phosphotransferase [Kribbella sp. NPDC048915]|uniref:phosphotransferase family protein n=1 Tax=Kribbella sp. NPDC048915 TaxID=3155148 RepID=UPI00340DD737
MPLTDSLLHDQLAALGHRDVEQLAVGMQGAVYRVGQGRIAKIWFHAGEAELRTLAELYDVIDGQLPYRTPRIHELRRPGPYWVTVEEELPGAPLYTVAPIFGAQGWERGRDCVLDVVAALAEVKPPEVLRRTAVLDETMPFRPEGVKWSEALVGLVKRRAERLDRTVVDGDKIAVLLERLTDLEEPESRLVHGDVTAGNILVDDDLRPVTLLDFGLLTMKGDPMFEAAAAASVIDLWSPRVREVEAAYDEAFAARLGYDRELLLLYRCAHSLIIAHAHDDDPYDRDSHEPLTAKLFDHPEVTALLRR